MPSDAQLIFAIRLDSSTGVYTVTDALTREHFAADSVSLGHLIAKLVRDPEIPAAPQVEENETVSTAVTIFKNVAAKIGGGASPYVDRLNEAEPLLHRLANFAVQQRRLSTRRKKPSKARQNRKSTA